MADGRYGQASRLSSSLDGAVVLIASLAAAAPAGQTGPSTSLGASRTYWAYVGAEPADRIHRLRFDGASLVVERTTTIGEIPNEMEGPHGLQTSRDGRHLFMTTGHGRPEGKLWIFDVSGDADTLVGPSGVDLGMFPASVDGTPDGLYTFSVNFNRAATWCRPRCQWSMCPTAPRSRASSRARCRMAAASIRPAGGSTRRA